MSQKGEIKGSCLCKAIEVVIQDNPKTFTVCHCESCRKWSGGVPMSINAGEHIKFSNEELVGRYSSSEWAERGFCKNCGSSIFFRLKKTDHYFLMAGLFGDAINPKFDMQEFIDCKPDYYSFSNETKTMTKTEAFKILDNYLSK